MAGMPRLTGLLKKAPASRPARNLSFTVAWQGDAKVPELTINVPMYLFFMALVLNDFDAGKFIIWAITRKRKAL